jgi:phage baseplate assembly protein W
MPNDDLNAQATYQFMVTDQNDNIIPVEQFSGQSSLLNFRFPPQSIQIQRSIRAEILRDIGQGYAITAGGEGIGNIRINATHGVGPLLSIAQASEGFKYRNLFRDFFKAFLDSNDARGKQGLSLLKMTFRVFNGKWSNPSNEYYYVWPENFPSDSRSASKPHAWDWSISLHILAEGRKATVVKDTSDAVIDPKAAITKLNGFLSVLATAQTALKKFKDIIQKIRDVVNTVKKIINGIMAFVAGTKDFIYSVSDLIRSCSQNITSLLKALNVNDFMNDVVANLRGTLYAIRETSGQVKITAAQWERAGVIPLTLTLPQTASLLRPVEVFANPGDTLASIAGRVLGDSTQWPKLASINNLDYPYLDFSGPLGAPDPSFAAAGLKVLGSGASIKMPLPSAQGNVAIAFDPFGTDLQDSQAVSGSPPDEALIGGLNNLGAAIIRRLLTPKGKIPWHPEYGSLLPTFIGTPQELNYIDSIELETEQCILSDPRILSVQSVEANIEGNSVQIQASVLTPLGPLNIAVPA